MFFLKLYKWYQIPQSITLFYEQYVLKKTVLSFFFRVVFNEKICNKLLFGQILLCICHRKLIIKL